MEDNKQNPGQDLSPEQVASISGGEGLSCPAPSVVLGPVTLPLPIGGTLVQIYEGFVDVTSHVIERLANTAK